MDELMGKWEEDKMNEDEMSEMEKLRQKLLAGTITAEELARL